MAPAASAMQLPTTTAGNSTTLAAIPATQNLSSHATAPNVETVYVTVTASALPQSTVSALQESEFAPAPTPAAAFRVRGRGPVGYFHRSAGPPEVVEPLSQLTKGATDPAATKPVTLSEAPNGHGGVVTATSQKPAPTKAAPPPEPKPPPPAPKPAPPAPKPAPPQVAPVVVPLYPAGGNVASAIAGLKPSPAHRGSSVASALANIGQQAPARVAPAVSAMNAPRVSMVTETISPVPASRTFAAPAPMKTFQAPKPITFHAPAENTANPFSKVASLGRSRFFRRFFIASASPVLEVRAPGKEHTKTVTLDGIMTIQTPVAATTVTQKIATVTNTDFIGVTVTPTHAPNEGFIASAVGNLGHQAPAPSPANGGSVASAVAGLGHQAPAPTAPATGGFAAAALGLQAPATAPANGG